ncbi:MULTISPECIES: peptide chain release factor N(5)-glutamine methyltransferase [Campylobacter]|uniref:peptide chain release factor N(5)-glutamine methyltransferase n=1 Tax=Campylobacter TaxID=194 RepID=UPI00027A3871|nr:peptide chain release factor N(5)-glutamine methyltransferase [Campylobacter sp. FOBRC14]EJP74397.1 protein-(glutamine-N5) methyltransferase, release factor-specific [Campylobacter sp. FOBRC14]
MKIEAALKEASTQISAVCESPRKVAKLLLMHHLGMSAEWIFLNLSADLADESGYFALVRRFCEYEPLEYITSKADFYGLNFSVRKGVLIPRPETEILVDKSLEILVNLPAARVAEIGTGSGIISICIALNSPAKITATDINETALDLARENAAKFGVVDRIEFIKCAYLDDVSGEFDLLVSNPPYIAQDYKLDKFVLNEPHNALFGGLTGDEILKNIILLARNRRVKNLACEMGYDQKSSLEKALKFNGFEAKFYQDLAGFDRGFTAKLALNLKKGQG